LKLLRPRQWTKNLVCVGGAFFSGHMFDMRYAERAAVVVVAFSAVSSFVYIVNDVLDREQDRNHPRKKLRPIAAGTVSIPQAMLLAVLMVCVAIVLAALLGPAVLAILATYVVMNFCYSAVLKNLSLVDATVVAAGFILRIYAGTAAVHVSPSAWLLLCAFFLSLFLAFGKRRAELNAVTGQKSGADAGLREPEAPAVDVTATRGVLHKYNVAMLDRFCNICATLTIATYALYSALGHPNRTLIVTTVPVVMGIFRYLLLVERYQEGEAPDAILVKDWPIQMAILLWLILYVSVIYFGLQIDVQ
jgi:4-hydroxybenzoate polyprenyltransferase